MATKEQIKDFFVRGRKVMLPDADQGMFLEFRKEMAICIRGEHGEGKTLSCSKEALIERNLGEW
jgi:hypothetical protein